MQQVDLNLVPSGVSPVVYASRYDENRELQFTIYSDATEYEIPADAKVTVFGNKPDKKSFSYSTKSNPKVISYSGAVVTINTTQQMTAITGTVECELRIEKDSSVLGTLNFKMVVEASSIPEDLVESMSDLQSYQEAINDSERYATAAHNSAVTAEGYANALDNTVKEATAVIDKGKADVQDLIDSGTANIQSITDKGKTDIQDLINKQQFSSLKMETETVTIEAAKWVGDAAPYTYTIESVSNDLGMLDLTAPNFTEEQKNAIEAAEFMGSDSNVLYAYGEKPAVDISLRLIHIKPEVEAVQS